MKPHRTQSVINSHRFGFFQMVECALPNDPLYSRKYRLARNIAAKKTTTLAKTTQSCCDMPLPFPLLDYAPAGITIHPESTRGHVQQARSMLKLTNDKSRCLTILEGRNKLGACGNSWNDCFKWIF